MKKLTVFVLLLILAGLSYFTYTAVFKKNQNSGSSQNQEKIKKYSNYVNCSDIRKVIEDNGKYYLSCYGGVLIADVSTGSILNQITMADGLSDFATTDLIKKGNTLYIGTQDGVTIWDLSTQTGRKLSVSQGLPNGANIVLAEDGKYIWIGAFDGLARLDTETNKLDVYKQELTTNINDKINVNKIAVSGDYVYVSVVASMYSRGEIARFNKKVGGWEKYTPVEFGDNSQYARIDAFGMCAVSDGVVFVEDKTLWKISNFEKTAPEKLFTAGFSDYIQFDILCQNDKALFKTEKNTLVYEAGQVRQADESKDSALLSELKRKDEQKDYKKLLGDKFYGSFGAILGVINDNVYFSASNGYWVLDTSTSKLSQISLQNISPNENLSDFVFWSVEKSSKFVIGQQTCGMGCGAPAFFVCNYPSNSCQKVILPDNVLKIIGPEGTVSGGDFGYSNLFSNVIKEKERLVFEVNEYISNKVKLAVLDGKNFSWSVEDKPSAENDSKDLSAYCANDNYYSFKAGAFSWGIDYCKAKAGVVSVGNYEYKFSPDLGAVRTLKGGGEEKLNATMTKPRYTPFRYPSWDKPQMNRLVSSGDKVYYFTNRGLWIFDTKNSNWNLVSIDNGSLSNEFLDARVTSKGFVILTPAGLTFLKF